ncbi:MAG: NAD(P)H-dependent oxidoreductase subunit E [Candidatus Omnitrophica bacterium]|nr:NAD(P)H-dependent oxidoreductase subunit E [Candidatus Omnitrophota bacterium]
MSLKECKEELKKILDEHGRENEALLPCLHAACERCGYLTEETISFLAKELNLPPVEVYSVATFYSMFNLKERGKFIIRICVSLPCSLKGSRKILEAVCEELDIAAGQTTPDKKFTVEAVSCLGACDKAPVMMINEELFGNLTVARAKEIISQYE